MALLELPGPIGMLYAPCESCEQRQLLRPVTLDSEIFYVCENCEPTNNDKE